MSSLGHREPRDDVLDFAGVLHAHDLSLARGWAAS
jgi:hypothetical protein